jgi:putative salt-induced outer membrane protein YdiY
MKVKSKGPGVRYGHYDTEDKANADIPNLEKTSAEMGYKITTHVERRPSAFSGL